MLGFRFLGGVEAWPSSSPSPDSSGVVDNPMLIRYLHAEEFYKSEPEDRLKALKPLTPQTLNATERYLPQP